MLGCPKAAGRDGRATLTLAVRSHQHVVVKDTTGGISTSFGNDDVTVPTRLLVLGMAHRNGTIVGSELYSVIEPCGLSIDQVRSCMRRLVNEGLFERTGEGRDAVFRSTATGRMVLGSMMQRHRLAYAQDAAGRGWDRTWRLVAFAIPEAKRSARDDFRDRLLALGAAPIHNGMYVSPHRWDGEVRAEVDRLGIAEHVTVASTDDLSIGGETNPRAIAEMLWPLDEVAARYRSFIGTYDGVPATLEAMHKRGDRISEGDFLPGALHIAIRFNQCFELDPMLPPELLPRPWPGRQAREILARCRRLGVLTREDKLGPALFQVFDDVVAALP